MKRAALLILALFIALPAAAQVYQWKDKDGNTHYSDTPPASGEAKTVIHGTTPSVVRNAPATNPEAATAELTDPTAAADPANPAAPKSPALTAPEKSKAERDLEEKERREKAAADALKADQAAVQEQKRAQECERARVQLAALTSGQRFARPTADGGRTILDDKERAVEINRAQEIVDAFCK
ncbi:hypothetical protein AGMMS50225_09140 [Betaproteobacteria bacterium]|nr:hypothetical protein AGMMS50225_09140 [Betaproteobacteria bacterium]